MSYYSRAKDQAILLNTVGGSQNVTIGLKDACWLGLFTDTVSETQPSSGIEVSGNNYSRINIAAMMSATYKSHRLSEATATEHYRSVGNVIDITSPEAYDPSDPEAASGADWGSIKAIGLFTAQTGGSAYYWGNLSTPITVNTHYVLNFRAGYFELYTADANA